MKSIAAGPARISRRHFLRSISMLAAGGLLAACAYEGEQAQPGGQVDLTLVDVQLPRGQAVATVQPDDAELAGFLTLSALLTGVEQLDPALGQTYLQSLRENDEMTVTVGELLEQAQAGSPALPTTLEALEDSGIFQDEAMRKLTDKIIEYWYTGVYDTAQGGQAVATYVEALAWKTLVFTKPTTVCGSYRFWTEPPEAEID